MAHHTTRHTAITEANRGLIHRGRDRQRRQRQRRDVAGAVAHRHLLVIPSTVDELHHVPATLCEGDGLDAGGPSLRENRQRRGAREVERVEPVWKSNFGRPAPSP